MPRDSEHEQLEGIHPDYQVEIIISSKRIFGGSSGPRSIWGRLPEEFGIDLSSTYSDQYQYSGEGIIDAVSLGLTGRVLTLGQFSAARWTGTTGLEFSLEVTFQAETDANLDVMRPVKILQQLAIPSRSSIHQEGVFDSEANQIRNEARLPSQGGEEGSSERGPESPIGPDSYREAIGSLDGIDWQNFSIQPPGPIPFGTRRVREDADNVTINIGGVLTIPKVIITQVGTTFSGILSQGRQHLPISAVCSLEFQSAVPTATDLLEIIYAGRQTASSEATGVQRSNARRP